MWLVEYTDEFGQWWDSLREGVQIDIDTVVRLLERLGPNLKFPYTSVIHCSWHGHMRELRVQHKGSPYRILYAFDPRRAAILLLGGDKTGYDDWYAKYVPRADQLYSEHLHELQQEENDNDKTI